MLRRTFSRQCDRIKGRVIWAKCSALVKLGDQHFGFAGSEVLNHLIISIFNFVGIPRVNFSTSCPCRSYKRNSEANPSYQNTSRICLTHMYRPRQRCRWNRTLAVRAHLQPKRWLIKRLLGLPNCNKFSSPPNAFARLTASCDTSG